MKLKSLAQAALLAATLACPAAFANLITNGGFEAPVVNGASGYNVRTIADAGWGWTTGSRGAVQFDATYAPGQLQTVGAGSQSVQLELVGDYIEQSIATTIGTTYNLSFLLASYAPPGVSALKVSVGGVGDSLFSGNSSWISQAFNFTATLASTSIRFTNNNLTAGFTYPHLDSIALASVPAPATLALVGLGLAALGWTRRQRA